MAKINELTEERLRRRATPRGAAGYAAWLSTQPAQKTDADRAAAEAEEVRSTPGYGKAGEALYGSHLANDGYAAYLQAAAKEARAARTERREAEAVSEGRAALAGYAAYLDGLRKTDGDRLVAAAESLTTTPADAVERRDRIVSGATTDPTARAILRGVHKKESTTVDTVDTQLQKTLSYIYDCGLAYDEAYEYCRLLGYGDARAKAIARYTADRQDPLLQELKDLFTD